MIYGYTRPLYNDSQSQNQLNTLHKRCDKIYQEAHGSPKKRHQLETLLMEIQPGDSILVEKMIVVADTLHHLMEVLKVCKKDRVRLHFLEEGIQSEVLLDKDLQDILEHMLQFQSDSIKQSTTLGIYEAKKQGKAIGRPKKSDENIKKAIAMYQDGFKLYDIKNETGISKSTLYRYLEVFERKEH